MTFRNFFSRFLKRNKREPAAPSTVLDMGAKAAPHESAALNEPRNVKARHNKRDRRTARGMVQLRSGLWVSRFGYHLIERTRVGGEKGMVRA